MKRQHAVTSSLAPFPATEAPGGVASAVTADPPIPRGRVRPWSSDGWRGSAQPTAARSVPARRSPGWPWWVALTAVLLVATLYRLLDLMAVGYNSDEAVYVGQGASLAGNPDFVGIFPIFRAHPLMFQALVSLFVGTGDSDLPGRLISALIGIATVAVVYAIGKAMYGRAAGIAAAAVLAVMPYHVIVTRQALLDGPMTFFAAVTLLLLAYYARSGRMAWLVAAGAALGLAALCKETALVLAGGVYLFLVVTPSLARRVRGGLLALAVVVGVFAMYPLSLMWAGHRRTGDSYLLWQLVRRPNHSYAFYLQQLPAALGWATLAAALLALLLARRRDGWREALLVCWILVPAAFFQAWPVKGYQYLLPVAPAVAVLAARGVTGVRLTSWTRRAAALPLRWPFRWRPAGAVVERLVRGVLAVAVVLSLAVSSWSGTVHRPESTTFLAGSGGVPGGRAAGEWLAANVPLGAQLLTIGPSMGNILQFYSHRRCLGIAVSSNPLHRNPAYTPVPNPDLVIRQRQVQYVVWDSYSAARSPTFSARVMGLVARFHGRVIHVQSVSSRAADGVASSLPVIVVYEVRP